MPYPVLLCQEALGEQSGEVFKGYEGSLVGKGAA